MIAHALLAAAVSFGATVSIDGAPISAGRKMGLEEACTLALERSEQIARGESAVREAEARVAELTGAILPNLSLDAAHTRQDKAAGSSSSDSRTAVWLNLRQPLFAGFREFLARRSGKESLSARRGDLEYAREKLRLDVVQAYLALYGFQREADLRAEALDHLAERVAQLERYRDIGRARESELISARYQQAQARAQLGSLKGDERQAQEVLKFLVGVPEDISTGAPDEPSLPGLEAGLASSKGRGDVEAARHDYAAAVAQAKAARGERLPVVAAEGNYRLKQDGSPQSPDWDAGVALTMPLFAGGSVSARVKEADARRESAAAALGRAERKAESETRSAHARLKAALDVLGDLSQARDLAEANVAAQERDYRNGLVTNLEVLAALNSFLDAGVQLERGRIEAALALAEYGLASGGRGKGK